MRISNANLRNDGLNCTEFNQLCVVILELPNSVRKAVAEKSEKKQHTERACGRREWHMGSTMRETVCGVVFFLMIWEREREWENEARVTDWGEDERAQKRFTLTMERSRERIRMWANLSTFLMCCVTLADCVCCRISTRVQLSLLNVYMAIAGLCGKLSNSRLNGHHRKYHIETEARTDPLQCRTAISYRVCMYGRLSYGICIVALDAYCNHFTRIIFHHICNGDMHNLCIQNYMTDVWHDHRRPNRIAYDCVITIATQAIADERERARASTIL